MTTRTPRNRAARAALFAALTLGVAAAGYALPAPTQPALFGRFLPADSGIHPRAVLTRAAADTTPVLDLSEVDVKPRVVNAADAVRAIQQAYPRAMRDAGRGGMVAVEMVVGADGTPSLTVPANDVSGFHAAAYTAARQFRFSPAREGGVPVAVRLSLPVSFIPAGKDVHPVSVETSITTTVRTDTVVMPAASSADTIAASRTGLMRQIAQKERELAMLRIAASRAARPAQPRLANAREVSRMMAAEYPRRMMNAGVHGTVTLDMVVQTDGTVSDVRVVRSDRPELSAPARRVAAVMRFRPAHANGRPVATRLQLPLTFQPRYDAQ